MKIPRRVAILFILTPFVHSSFSQSLQIAGFISDVQSGLPIPNVQVVINESQRGSLSHDDGNFSFKAFTPGLSTLTLKRRFGRGE